MNTSFFDTLKWTLVTYKESYIKGFFGLLIGFAIATALSSSFFLNIVRDEGFYYKYAIVSTWIFVWLIASMIIASTTFGNMQDKHSRTWFMMLPAKNSHKFWSRIIINFLLATIGTLVAMLTMDLVVMAIQFLFHGRTESVTAAFFDIVKGLNDYHAYIIFGLMLLMSYTAYILGSVIFRKWSWLWTTISWNIIWTVIMFIVGLVVNAMDIEDFFVDIRDLNAEYLFYSFCGFLVLVISFNVCASYIAFKRMQLITGKWFNL